MLHEVLRNTALLLLGLTVIGAFVLLVLIASPPDNYKRTGTPMRDQSKVQSDEPCGCCEEIKTGGILAGAYCAKHPPMEVEPHEV